ncbi:MAG: HesA/MoeB/ThiF family protein [Desulfobacteraceae bacterium]|nr:HesA/MoeB/ThiF family protein [Desulfobacteraceae bacterium]
MRQHLTDIELETYARQIVLEDIGYNGQLKLRNAKACIIGMGGLGTLIAFKLVGMGIGYLRIVDRDIVSRSDLHRQYIYDSDSVGQPKIEVAHRKLNMLNPDVKLDPFPESLNSNNANELIGGVDVVLDGLDSPETRYLINRTCNKLKIPYVFGAAIKDLGNVSTLVPGQTVCLECFMPGLKDDDLPKCGIVGVHPSALGIVTSVQVFEAIRLILGQEPKLLNKLLYIDLGDMKFHMLNLSIRENCLICGLNPTGFPEPIKDRFFEETCARDGRRNFILSPKERVEINFEQLRIILRERGFRIKTSGLYGITFEQSDDVTTSILKSGVMIVQTSPNLKSNIKNDVFHTYKSILVNGLGLSLAILPEG